MTDAQPADQIVAAMEAALAWLLDSGSPAGLLEDMEATLPIAREMAERERELAAALLEARRLLAAGERDPNEVWDWMDATGKLIFHRARAAGVEVTGHE